jgi:hypothetical protein
VGLVAALTLLQNGISVRIIDKDPHPRIGQCGAGIWVCHTSTCHIVPWPHSLSSCSPSNFTMNCTTSWIRHWGFPLWSRAPSYQNTESLLAPDKTQMIQIGANGLSSANGHSTHPSEVQRRNPYAPRASDFLSNISNFSIIESTLRGTYNYFVLLP